MSLQEREGMEKDVKHIFYGESKTKGNATGGKTPQCLLSYLISKLQHKREFDHRNKKMSKVCQPIALCRPYFDLNF